jgi:hypothetical protein
VHARRPSPPGRARTDGPAKTRPRADSDAREPRSASASESAHPALKPRLIIGLDAETKSRRGPRPMGAGRKPKRMRPPPRKPPGRVGTKAGPGAPESSGGRDDDSDGS